MYRTFGVIIVFINFAAMVGAAPIPPGRLIAALRAENAVAVIDVPGRSVTKVGVGTSPTRVLASPVSGNIYVSNQGSNSVSVISSATGQVVDTIAVGNSPTWMALNRDGSRLYVSNSASGGGISVVNTATDTVIETVQTLSFPGSVALHPIRDELWVGLSTPGGVVLEARSTTADNLPVVAELTGARLYGGGISFTADGALLYAVENCGYCGRVHVVSGDSAGGSLTVVTPDLLFDNSGSANAVAVNAAGVVIAAKEGQNPSGPGPYLAPIGAGAGPKVVVPSPARDLLFSSDGATLYSSAADGMLRMYDASSLTFLDSIAIGSDPYGLAIAVPEPSAVVLCILASAVMLRYRRGRQP